jgi:predicted GNAT family N-acyltransferase
MSWIWEVSTNVEEVHTLLCASDAYTANTKAPAPIRNIETTRRRVHEGSVHVLRFENEPVAMFTLTWDAPFSDDTKIFPFARKPAYIGRLAVQAEWQKKGSIVGAQCLRKAIELAKSLASDVIRSEANPDLIGVRTLLDLFGFKEYGQAQSEDGRRCVYLQKNLTEGASI